MRRPPADPFDAISHLVGGVAGLFGTVWLFARADTVTELVAAAVYGLGMLTMFGASTLYHWVGGGEGTWWQRADHVAIYAMIAGTYTPVCLLGLPPSVGRPMLGMQWGLVAAGLALNLVLRGGPHWIRVVIYLLQGWMIAAALPAARAGLTELAFLSLVAGGLAYTIGVVYFATDRRRWPGKNWGHEIWHLFVLAGAGLHFLTVSSLF